MTLYKLIGTVVVGLIFGLVALGAFLSFRVLDFPDLRWREASRSALQWTRA
jgi:putative ABC transport system permease protein